MKEIAEKQASVEHFLSIMKGAMLKFQPQKLAFVGIGERRKVREEAGFEKHFSLAGERVSSGKRRPKKQFNFGSVLHLRTFAFLIVGTVLLVVYINNLLKINALSRENERLRESIGISRSINAALELELQELHTIHNISERAEEIGLRARITPAVKISGK